MILPILDEILEEKRTTPTPEEKQELIEAFLACKKFRIQEIRELVCDPLPSEVKSAINHSEEEEEDIKNIVTTCLEKQYPNSVEILVNNLFNDEGKSDEWQNLSSVWIKIRPPECQDLSSQDERPVISKTYSRIGEEICINRRWECTTFNQMRANDPDIPQRILAFQVRGGQGKSLLLKRFNYFCEVDALKGKLILHSKVDFRDQTMTAESLVCKILRTFISNAKKASQKLPNSTNLSAAQVTRLRETYDKIIDQLNKTLNEVEKLTSDQAHLPISPLQQQQLAMLFSDFCRSISGQWTVVLLLDTWEDAGIAGKWLLDECILTQVMELDHVVVVLAGRQGLSPLEERPDEVIYRTNLEPVKYADDCQRWAELKYKLPINPMQAKIIINRCGGDLQKIDMVLSSFKIFPEILHALCQE